MSIELDGVNYAGSYRVMTGSVIVRYDNETRSAQYGANRPETVARWLLADLCRKCDSRKRKAGKR